MKFIDSIINDDMNFGKSKYSLIKPLDWTHILYFANVFMKTLTKVELVSYFDYDDNETLNNSQENFIEEINGESIFYCNELLNEHPVLCVAGYLESIDKRIRINFFTHQDKITFSTILPDNESIQAFLNDPDYFGSILAELELNAFIECNIVNAICCTNDYIKYFVNKEEYKEENSGYLTPATLDYIKGRYEKYRTEFNLSNIIY